MKLRLIACALIMCNAYLPLMGMDLLWYNKQQPSEQPTIKFKITNAEKLKKRAEEANLNPDFLKESKFLELFAEQELSLSEIQDKITTVEDNVRNTAKEEVTKRTGTLISFAIFTLFSSKFTFAIAKKRPNYYQALLAEDYPEEFKKLPEYAELQKQIAEKIEASSQNEQQ